MDDIRPAPRPALSRAIAARWRHDLLFFLIAGAVLSLDQLTKWLVRANLEYGETWPADGDTFVRIIHVTNSGAAFGLLEGQTSFLVVTSLLGLAAILLYYVFPPMEHGIIRVALGMQLGGALGNLIDRIRMREVTDFIDVGRFPTFNVADSSITVSIVAVLVFFALQEAATGKPPQQSDVGAAAGDD